MEGNETTMKRNDGHIILSMICVVIFALLLAALDIGGWWICRGFAVVRTRSGVTTLPLMITLYSASVFGWICLVMLWRLLGDLRRGEVFVNKNVSLMRVIGYCCAAVSVICLISAIYYFPFVFIAAAAAFMFLIVHIVADSFRQAIAMRSELDLTI